MGKDKSSEGLIRLQNLEVKITKKTIMRGNSQIHKERVQLKKQAVPTPFKSKEYNPESI